jgi:CBS domain containing-hemolysin-like protein
MTDYIIAIILLLLSVAGVVIRKTYNAVPLRELKRRAAAEDPFAVKLYPVVSYGRSLRGLLWLFIALTSAAGVVMLSRDAPVWLSLLAVILLLWAAYSWLPQSRTTPVGRRLTLLANPVILWLLGHLHPALDRTAGIVEKRYTAEDHTGLYEREDLVSLIEQLQTQHDSRFSEEELEIAKRALSFDEFEVSSILTPKKSVKSALADDTVGPVLIDELHKSQQDHILVRQSAKGEFVGTLNYKHLNLHSSGKVKDYMDASINYVHEDDSLSQALKTFFDTNNALFVVVNNAEEYIGIVTIENILKQLLGHMPGEDFDQHSNPAAVVARHKKARKADEEEYEFVDEDEPAPAPESEEPDQTPVKTDDEVIE